MDHDQTVQLGDALIAALKQIPKESFSDEKCEGIRQEAYGYLTRLHDKLTLKYVASRLGQKKEPDEKKDARPLIVDSWYPGDDEFDPTA